MQEENQEFQNTLYTGDNLYILNGLNSEIADLIYLDPPFNSNRMYDSPLGGGTNFSDIWVWKDIDEDYLDEMQTEYPQLVDWIKLISSSNSKSTMAYITYMAQRLIQMHRILKPTGSLYYHCDPTAGAYVKEMLDFIFGGNNFRNEIIWQRNKTAKGSQHKAKRFGVNTDCIYFYTKSDDYYFNANFIEKELDEKFPKIDEDGRRYNTATPLYCSKSMGERPNLCYKWHGFSCPHPSGWRLSKERMDEEYAKGNIVIIEEKGLDGKIISRKIERRAYLDEYEGFKLDNLWTDIPRLTGKSKEYVGQRTQKPLKLLNRIINASCPVGGLVVDPFCGCATTCIAAEIMNRKWIGIDIDKLAVRKLAERITTLGDIDLQEIGFDDKYRQGLFDKSYIVLDKPSKRTDVVEKDITEPTTRNEIKEILYQKQKGRVDENGMKKCLCNGCFCEYLLKDLEIDHIIPKAKGGGNYLENYQLLCSSCNRMKGYRTMAYLRMKNKAIRKILDEVEFGE